MKLISNTKNLLVLSAILIIALTCSFRGNDLQPAAEALYRKNCKQCHGTDGARGFMGAKNLRLSRLETSAIVRQVRDGKGIMPSFARKFTPEELEQLAGYVKGLRQN